VNVQLDDFAPFLSWLRRYRWGYFRADLNAGLTVAVVAVPQSMAYALIAGLPVQYGLYAAIVPTIVGCLWGSSAQLITAPTTAGSLVVFSSLIDFFQPGSPQYIQHAFFLSLMVGAIQIIMGIARLGRLLDFVSHAVLLGFTAGAAVLIAFNQLPSLLGLKVAKSGVFLDTLIQTGVHLHETHLVTLLLGLLTMAVILVMKKIRPTWPGTLVAMVFVGLVVGVFHLAGRGVSVVGAIPRSLPPLSLPEVSVGAEIGMLAQDALAIAILGLVESVSIAKAIAGQTHQRLNINREFIGRGLANLAGGMFSGYPAGGSFIRSAVNFRSGGKTPMSGVVSGVAVALTVIAAAPLAGQLPRSALAAVLLVVAYEMIRKDDIKRTIRATRSDGMVLTVTFLSALLLSIEFAVYVGVLLSIGLHLAKTSHPRIYSTVPDLSTGKMVGSAYGEICCQMDIVCIEGSIFFGSAAYVLEDLQRRLRNHPEMANLLLRMRQVNTMDASGVHALEILLEEVRERGGSLFLSALNPRVFDVFKNSGFLKEVGEPHVRTSTRGAIRQAMRENFCPVICAACEFVVFVECPDLKQGNWEIFGKNVQPRLCVLPKVEKEVRPGRRTLEAQP
jgi:SulP family sulfate permease